MTLRNQSREIKVFVYEQFDHFFKYFATKLGFPEVKGMLIQPKGDYWWNKPSVVDRLPVHKVAFPPATNPKTYIEVLLGDLPKPAEISRYFYESTDDGYYNFYIQNYKNIVFLPNGVSEFLQIRCHFCLDITFLEVCRETLFAILVIYYHAINLRLVLAWLVAINPYTIPLCYFIASVDWIEEASIGILPVLGGVSFGSPLLLAVVGKMADSLNHLVFTMPFLPSEGVPTLALVEGEVEDVLVFRHLPYLWYKYPIPNEIREFWSYQRPEILLFMEKYYKHLDIELLPDPVIVTEQVINNIN